METKRGCLKYGLLGCLGMVALFLLLLVITAFVAWRGIDKQQIEEGELRPALVAVATLPAEPAAPAAPDTPDAPATPAVFQAPRKAAGRVILELGQGEFEIRPAPPGSGIRVETHYDSNAHELVDELTTLPDSSWVYRIRFRQTISGLQAMFRALLGGDTDAYVHVYLPPDIPIALEVSVEKGGFEAELGGLWITETDIRYAMGGFSLDVSEPLREPMESLTIHGKMGGFEAGRLGNASPRVLTVECQMGGADVDLRGDWLRDCDISLAVRMGGMAVIVPDEVEVEGVPGGEEPELRRADRELSPPLLRFSLSQSMGEIEVIHR